MRIIREGANTLKGLVQITCNFALGAEFKTIEQMKQDDAANSAKAWDDFASKYAVENKVNTYTFQKLLKPFVQQLQRA